MKSIKRKKSAWFVHVYESRRKHRATGGGRRRKRKGKEKWTVCLYGLWDPLPPCSSSFSADDSPTRREGHSSMSLFSYSWWRVCKSMWRANEQESRARFGLWEDERHRFKTLNLRTAFYLTLSEQINSISKALGLHIQKPTSFPFGSLFRNNSLTTAQITASRRKHSPIAASRSGRQQPRVRPFISTGTQARNRLLASAC